MRPKSSLNVPNDGQRAAIPLARNLEKNLLAYVAVAGAGLFSAVQSAEAEVVYTPSNVPITQGFAGGALTPLDLNNDGTPDFTFSNFSYQTHGLGGLWLKLIPAQPANEVWGTQLAGQRRVTAAALPAGVQVGSKGNFASSPQGLNLAIVDVSLTSFASGSWLGVETAYLGLKFVISGEVHYGWARVKFVAPGAFYSGSIYGYAFESVPNQPIVTGQTSGTAETGAAVGGFSPTATNTPHKASASLGLLAAGASGLGMTRELPAPR
jgi:hypothetical protein